MVSHAKPPVVQPLSLGTVHRKDSKVGAHEFRGTWIQGHMDSGAQTKVPTQSAAMGYFSQKFMKSGEGHMPPEPLVSNLCL